MEEPMNTETLLSVFSVDPEGNYWVAPDPSKRVVQKTLPPGPYQFHVTMTGNYFEPFTLHHDHIIESGEAITKQVLGDICKFFSPDIEARYRRYGYVYKRGILLYGVPGAGKSVTIYQVIREATKRGYITLINQHVTRVKTAVEALRSVIPDQKVLVVLEEVDDPIQNGYERHLLQLLDGVDQIQNVVYLATTNYIDKIPPRIKNRPSRFATVIEVPTPGAEVRRHFLENRVHPDDLHLVDVDKWVAGTKGMVLDQINEIIKSVVIFEQTFEVASAKIRKMQGLTEDAPTATEPPDENEDENDDD